MNAWTLICPVCGGELPERGNRRLRIPWLSGRLKLVHAGCAPLVAAQGVLEEPPPWKLDPVLLALARRKVTLLLNEPAQHTREELLTIARRFVADLRNQEFVGHEGDQQLDRSPEHLRQLVDRVLSHDREVSGSARTELLA